MADLDRQEQPARKRETPDGIPASVAVRHLRELPETWREAGNGPGRQLLARAPFERIDVLGVREATVHLRPTFRHPCAGPSGRSKGSRRRPETAGRRRNGIPCPCLPAAALLGISPETVRWHLARLFERCGFVDEAQAGWRHYEEIGATSE